MYDAYTILKNNRNKLTKLKSNVGGFSPRTSPKGEKASSRGRLCCVEENALSMSGVRGQTNSKTTG